MSDSQRLHWLQPTRLLHPWGFPGKSTGVGCHWLLHYAYMYVLIYVCLSLQLRQDKGKKSIPATGLYLKPCITLIIMTPSLIRDAPRGGSQRPGSSLITQPALAVIANTLPLGRVRWCEGTWALQVSVNVSSRGLFNIRSKKMRVKRQVPCALLKITVEISSGRQLLWRWEK